MFQKMINPDILFGRLGNRMFQGAYLYTQMKEGKIPDIYVQDIKYFEKYQNEIKKWFGDGIGYIPYTSVHIRRGDYVDNPFYVDLSKTGYYIDAINKFPNDKFLVFSDDIDFAKFYFEGDKFAFDDSSNEIEAFNKMASCQNNIIANSSFSWWAAFCNPQENQKVVYPSLWFSDKIERVGFPKAWIKI